MSILINGMEMPKNCERCKFCFAITSDHIGKCAALEEFVDNVYKQRSADCPLIEVPTPHGDLVDKDKLIQEFIDSDLDHLQRDDWKEVIQIVADAPTIIEGSEE